jgi:biopolymer transport protein ExbD
MARRRRARQLEVAELDMIPLMSLIVKLVPMLLLFVRFSSLSVVEAAGPVVPATPASSPGQLEEQDERVVSVRIDGEGFVVGGLPGGSARLPCSGPCAPDTFDYTGLTQAMAEAKRARPGESRVVIVPGGDVAYDVVVRVMDATRARKTASGEEPLFPVPLLAAESP